MNGMAAVDGGVAAGCSSLRGFRHRHSGDCPMSSLGPGG